jgi:hypothetical protein
MQIELQKINEVWYEATKQYDLVVDGKEISFRWKENSNGSDFYILTEEGWNEWDTNLEYEEVYEKIINGELA